MTRVEREPLLWRRRSRGAGRSRVGASARVVAALGLSALGGLVVVGFASQAVGFSAHVVTSGSMAPRVEPGDVVLTRATTTAQLRSGQIILFADPDRPGGLLLHRLVSFDPAGKLVTRGDANQSDDSVHVAPSAVRGVAQVRVPWIGLPAVWRGQGRFGPIALAAALVGAAAVFVASGRGSGASDEADPHPRGAGHDSSTGLRPPMTAAESPAVPRATGRGAGAVHHTVAIDSMFVERMTAAPRTVRASRSTEEERDIASSAGYFLPPVPRSARGRDRAARPGGPPGRRHGGDGHLRRCCDCLCSESHR
jgi:signal peptidase